MNLLQPEESDPVRSVPVPKREQMMPSSFRKVLTFINRGERRVEPPSLPATLDAGDPPPDWKVPPDQRWGPLRLIERIGAGTFGEVYRAWDEQLDREVALKLFAGDDPGLLIEGRLLARVRHHNIAVVHGAGLYNGRVGLWMELIPGRTLAAITRDQGPLG